MRFVFITGITNLNKTSIIDDLNNLSDLSLYSSYGTLLGFTREEVEQYFGDHLTRAAEVLNMEKSKLMEELVDYYDGYCFDEKTSRKVFAPWSLLNFLSYPESGFRDYWVESGGNPTALLQYMDSPSLVNPEEFGKEKYVALNVLNASTWSDDLSDVGLLTQTGYLTLKKVVGSTAIVWFPNAEVRTSMAQLYLEMLLNGKTAEQVEAGGIVSALGSETSGSVIQKLNNLFNGIVYEKYPVIHEATVRAYVQVYLAAAGVKFNPEESDQVRSDLEVTSGNRLWVFEFKTIKENESAEEKLQEAINQIVERDYGNPTEHQELKKVAMVFSLEARKFVKWAEV